MKQLTVRSGKGDKDRFTTFPATLTPLLQNHLARVKTLHQQDAAQGHGEVYLPCSGSEVSKYRQGMGLAVSRVARAFRVPWTISAFDLHPFLSAERVEIARTAQVVRVKG